MRIIFVTTELATNDNSSGGLASFTANMARIFHDRGHDVTVLVVSTAEQKLHLEDEIEIHSVFIPKADWDEYDYISRIYSEDQIHADNMRKTWVRIKKMELVRQKIEELSNIGKIDIVHYCSSASLSLFASSDIPYIVRVSSYRNLWFPEKDTPRTSLRYEDNQLSASAMLEKHMLQKCRYIVSPSNLLADIGKRYLNINPIVIESPFALDSICEDKCIWDTYLKNKQYVLYYGTLRYLKGAHILAGIAKEFLNKNKEFYLVLAGRDTILRDQYDDEEMKASDYIKKYAEEYCDRVVYLGSLEREKLYPIIKNAELCILPSRIENLSNACIEAMAMGKIVVATNGASYEQLIEDGVNGFLRERDNPDSFLEGIERVLSLSKSEKKILSENAKETVDRLSPANVYQQYLAYYQKVIQEW